MPPRWGGCGLLPLSDLADVLTVAHAYRMLTVRDGAVKGLAWESLRGSGLGAGSAAPLAAMISPPSYLARWMEG